MIKKLQLLLPTLLLFSLSQTEARTPEDIDLSAQTNGILQTCQLHEKIQAIHIETQRVKTMLLFKFLQGKNYPI